MGRSRSRGKELLPSSVAVPLSRSKHHRRRLYFVSLLHVIAKLLQLENQLNNIYNKYTALSCYFMK